MRQTLLAAFPCSITRHGKPVALAMPRRKVLAERGHWISGLRGEAEKVALCSGKKKGISRWRTREFGGAMIEICEAPKEAERAAILKPLLEFNRCAVGDAGHSRVAILIRDDNTSEVTGGLWASVFYNWLYVELLCVPEAARGSGIGTALLATAESIAIARNCVGVWLDTYEFQAPAFYEKLGYEVFARLPQYPRGYERFFLKKMVDNAATGYSGAKAR